MRKLLNFNNRLIHDVTLLGAESAWFRVTPHPADEAKIEGDELLTYRVVRGDYCWRDVWPPLPGDEVSLTRHIGHPRLMVRDGFHLEYDRWPEN